MPDKLLLATHNAHKVTEIRAVLDPRIALFSLDEINDHLELPETGNTLEANALEKATTAFHRHRIACIADDSGLEVNALSGAPGVNSAHYAGPQRSDMDNINRLLRELENVEDRRARFRTVIAFVDDGRQKWVEGTVTGSIARERRGGNGFGYDPVFIPEGYSKTFAEMSSSEKNAISHRSRAIAAFVDLLTRLYPE